MADLKKLYESLGFESVIPYIQSGNVIFKSDKKDIQKLSLVLEKAIETQYGFHVPVCIRSAVELKTILLKMPFNKVTLAEDGSRVLFTFCSLPPAEQRMQDVQSYVKSTEKMVLQGHTIFLHCPNGYGKSKLSNAFLERKLGILATTRNWKTVTRLCELSAI